MTQYKLITALCRGGGIGYNGYLPWPRIAKDMRYFAEMTRAPNDSSIRVAVLMGRKTWDSLPSNVKPLKDRGNIIMSSSSSATNNNTNVIHINHIEQIKAFEHKYDIIWIIGGASIYEQCIRSDEITVSEMYITFINACYDFDTKFPEIRLHVGLDDEDKDKNKNKNIPPFDWNYTESMPPYATFELNPYAHYSIETIDFVNASPDCPELRFLKFIRI